jgi:hypothetical protein
MILADIKTSADQSAYFNFFHGGRFALVRYIDGPSGEHLRTEKEAQVAALQALAGSDDRVVTVR